MSAEESYPDGLKYHPEHDWARIEGDEATLGITWYAQDSLGELVHYEAPPEGVVTSGTMSPCLDYGIGMAYVPVASAEPGTPIEVDVRGKLRPAEIRKKPLYSKET